MIHIYTLMDDAKLVQYPLLHMTPLLDLLRRIKVCEQSSSVQACGYSSMGNASTSLSEVGGGQRAEGKAGEEMILAQIRTSARGMSIDS